jgi:5-methylcytosine-specific restriction protein A
VTRSPELQARKRFYDSARWKAVRAQKLRRNPLCEVCTRIGHVVAATEVDHHVPLARGGAELDLANLTAMCASCHGAKTRAEEAGADRAPIKGACVHGWPLDPAHAWNRTGGCPDCSDGSAPDRTLLRALS